MSPVVDANGPHKCVIPKEVGEVMKKVTEAAFKKALRLRMTQIRGMRAGPPKLFAHIIDGGC